ncbi:PEP-CTERM sorting domain-containing protein [Verrucomicrobium spinosum]|uniref:PEP-CTERM sorting domain-containing protein n=1 Tax=Verrucomicrobium spinosum TaxID=2736 RepID=UPI0009466D78|nr:PEP-CTERM sorting domain-containing protein [Verrucomicrobium spinosum]
MVDGSFWQLIDWGTVLQANRTVNYSTITLPEIAGYEWINTLSTDGRITLSAVPEPGRMVLLLLGGGLMLIQRRRRQERPARV